MELSRWNMVLTELMIRHTEQRQEEMKAENQIRAIKGDPNIRKV